MFPFTIKPWMYITAAILLGAIFFYTCGRTKQPKIANENRTATIADTINYKDLYNAEHLRVTELISENALSKAEVDTLKDRLSVKQKQIDKYIKTKIQIPGNTITGKLDSTKISIKETDTATGRDTIVQHEAFTATIKDNLIDGIATVIPDIGIITLTYKPIEIQINHAEMWKRRRLFGLKWKIAPRIGRKIYYIDAWCDNPLIKIGGLESYQINK